MAGLFNKNDNTDFKINVNGKDVSAEEGAQLAKEFFNKMTSEMGGIVNKIAKNTTGVEALKEKIPSDINLDSIKERIMPHVNVDSFKEYVNEETLSKLQEKLPVIDASNDDGNIKLNVNGKPLFTLNLSDFIKK
ncbi:hypothetical protein [Bacillus sp. B1-b2]|uniref:hypothetical protein n=1 Tax=Bacillus sp. B1-b2 TaxID=2653201 RepID=UPI001261E1AD|nr:hypothetical protein [Bacillus sp. B1-b2]KAB7668736.1 hypothetical protein F9279_12980 [Bacillus sp. B1-b2]